jgi:glycine betaine/choline ABC-type transport system substrate-binding protein
MPIASIPRRDAIRILVGGTLALASCHSAGAAKTVIGSKNFTEQIILGELLAQQIEAHTALQADRRLNLGGTILCHEGLLAGRLDMYVEYTGTALTAILNQKPSNDAAAVYRAVRDSYRDRFSLAVGPPLGFNNTFAIIVRGDDSARLQLRTISDLIPHARQMRAGFGYEFMERPDGYRGLSQAYALHFGSEPRIMDLGLLYRALQDKQVDVVAGNSTDGLIATLGLVVLEDDRNFFPPYQAVTIVRNATLSRDAELHASLDALGGKITDDDMRRMNYAVDGQHRDVAVVVREFRSAHGL